MKKMICAVAVCLSLAACGGGGGGGAAGLPTGQSLPPAVDAAAVGQPATAKVEAASEVQGLAAQQADRTQAAGGLALLDTRSSLRSVGSPSYTYKLGRVNFADSSAFLTELNSAEMAGFLFYNFMGSSQSTNGELRAIYQKRGDAAGYEHRMQLLSEAGTLAGLQSQGAEGYLQTGIRVDADFKAIFSKPLGRTASYDFVDSEALVPGVTVTEFLASLNRFGAQGYCKLDLSQDSKIVLGRDSSMASRCAFEYGPFLPTTREFVDVMNEKGAKGARFVLSTSLGGERSTVFVRDETQQTVFHHSIVELPSNGTAEESLAFLNREGALGARPFQSFSEGNRTYIIFMTGYGCKGLLC